MNTLDVAPELLGEVIHALPKSAKIVGSEKADSYVRLVLDCGEIPSGPLVAIVTDSRTRRIVDLMPA